MKKIYFVGNTLKNPSFLIEVNTTKKIINIYKPDKYSKKENFYEKYALGSLIINTEYDDITFVKKPVSYKSKGLADLPVYPSLFVPEITFNINNTCLVVSKKINSD